MMALLPMLALSAAAAMQPVDCASLRGTSGTTVVDAATAIVPTPEWRPETTSFYKPEPVRAPLCRVVGRIEGSIGFELWLPMQWNGRLLGAGVGGDAGVINYRDMSLRVGQGFAVVSTDSGHKVENQRWMREPKARVDYEHRAVHLTVQSAKALVTRFYGQAAARA